MLNVNTKQKHFTLDLDSSYQNVGIKMSGGADSSLIAYMLCKYIVTHNNNIQLHAITLDNPIKPYQVQYAKNVIRWLENQFDIKFSSHTTNIASKDDAMEDEQEFLLYDCYHQHSLDCHFMGVTGNPIDYTQNQTLEKEWHWRDQGRDLVQTYAEHDSYLLKDALIYNAYNLMPPITEIIIRSFTPFANVDKRCIAELYDYFELTDTLFPITRSCERETTDFSSHCGTCWWCGEREYAFGKLA